ncbi:hypothetical protein U1Q18_041127 [Sarracenia purpurea var. burkii]
MDRSEEDDDLAWILKNCPFYSPDYWDIPMPENNPFVFPPPTSLNPSLEDPLQRLPLNQTSRFRQPYDLALETDFLRLYLSNPPVHQNNSVIDSSSNRFHPGSYAAVVEAAAQRRELNLHRLRVESAVRGQTGFYYGSHGSPAPGDSQTHDLNSNSVPDYWYDNSDNSRRNIATAMNVAPARSRNGFQPAYNSGSGASINSNGGGFRLNNNFGHRRARFGRDNWSLPPIRLSSKLVSEEKLKGKMDMVARDHGGYSFLKKKIDGGKREDIDMIFMGIKDYVRELMMDRYGNYLIQKIFAVCNEEQMTQMLLLVISDERFFASICVDTHGTRAIQTMLNHLTTPEQISLLSSALSRNSVVLTKSMTGLHLLQHRLKLFAKEDIEQLVHVLANDCVNIGMSKAGCCLLQDCLKLAEGEPMQRLVSEIIANSLLLSESEYGNYVVQFILQMRVPAFTENLLAELAGNYISLSLNKFGSNVVENCMRTSGEEQAAKVIKEIINGPNFLMILQDPYGNYVAQAALTAAKV